MDERILHVDCNKFYASVECCLHPELRDKPVVVGGDEELRHGIVLTKNDIAARYGLVTGENLRSARQKCPSLIIVPPHFEEYARFSGAVRSILDHYSDRIEPFGLDEAWLDLTDCPGDPLESAHAIRRRVKRELGITVSIGVSFTKTFAKLGSDYKKPDAVTLFSRENYRQLVWPLPARDMLFVGAATAARLAERYIFTIGDIARSDPALLRSLLGKGGDMLYAAANGQDRQPVIPAGQESAVQSVSNGMTTPRDLEDEQDVRVVMFALAENVGRRLRRQHLCGKIMEVVVRDNGLSSRVYRATLSDYVQGTEEIAEQAMTLFIRKHEWHRPLRSVTIGISGLAPEALPSQMNMHSSERQARRNRLNETVDQLHRRFGNDCLRHAVILENPALAGVDTFEVHPFRADRAV